jgi:hypothetical protein
MSAKDYITIACCIGRAIHDSKSEAERRGIASVQQRLTLELELDNPRFNRRRFEAFIVAASEDSFGK